MGRSSYRMEAKNYPHPSCAVRWHLKNLRVFVSSCEILQPVKTTAAIVGEPPDSSVLAVAREALATYRTRCFWSLAPDFDVTPETLPIIIAGLRRHGDRKAFQLAARLCR